MLKGYAAAFPDYIVEVPGGVARATETPEGKVAVINGGGSGHYPAFCGVVGSGFMDAAVVGNVFTSPSTDDVYHVAKAVENGNGVEMSVRLLFLKLPGQLPQQDVPLMRSSA